MKKSSVTEFKQNETQRNEKKTDLIDLDKYRLKKQSIHDSTQESSNKKDLDQPEGDKNSSDFESRVIRMEAHKKRYQNPSIEEDNLLEKEQTIVGSKKKEQTKVIILEDYKKKKKWKKDFFVNTAQIAGMSFLFLFMLMNLAPNLRGGDSKTAKLNWFQAPINKGIVIRGLASQEDKRKANRTPDSSNPCATSAEEDPVKAMNKINPKNKDCLVNKF